MVKVRRERFPSYKSKDLRRKKLFGVLESMAKHGHEQVVFCYDKTSGLRAIIGTRHYLGSRAREPGDVAVQSEEACSMSSGFPG